MATQHTLRELGPSEQLRAAMHNLGFHNNVSLSVHLTGPELTLLQLQKIVYDGFRNALEHHLALWVTLDGLRSKPAIFTSLSEVNLSECVSFLQLTIQNFDDTGHIDAFLSKENSAGFTRSALPVWRAVVHYCLEKELTAKLRLSFIWHHVIADGRSGLAAFRTILEGVEAAGRLTASTPHAMTAPDPVIRCPRNLLEQGLPVNLETAIHKSQLSNHRPAVSVSSIEVCLDHSTRQGKKWFGSNFTANSLVTTRVRHISLPAIITCNLVRACRQRGVTITPLIQAVVAKLIFEANREAGWLRSAVAIDLKPFFDPCLGITAEDMGFWVTAFHVEMARNELEQGTENLWQRAERSAVIFRHWVSKGEGDVDLESLSKVGDFEQMLLEQVGRERSNSFGITNLGVWDMTGPKVHESFDAPTFNTVDILFSQSAHVTGSALQVCVVTAKDGPTSITLTWQDGVTEDAIVNQVAIGMCETLCSLGGGEDAAT